VFFPNEWWCCIHSAERQVLRALALAYTVGMGEPIDELIWQAAWGVTLASRALRQNTFLAIYPLEKELPAPDADPEILPVYAFTDDTFWLECVAFLLDPDSACLEGCERWYPP